MTQPIEEIVVTGRRASFPPMDPFGEHLPFNINIPFTPSDPFGSLGFPAFSPVDVAILQEMAAIAAASELVAPSGEPEAEAALEGAMAGPLPGAPTVSGPQPFDFFESTVPFVDFPTFTGPPPHLTPSSFLGPTEAEILAEMQAAADFPSIPSGFPSPEAIAEGAVTQIPGVPIEEQIVVRPTTERDLPPLIPIPPLPPTDGGNGGTMAELPDLILAGLRVFGPGGALGGDAPSLGSAGFGGVPLPALSFAPQATPALFGFGGNGNGCPPARPRMPSAVVTPNPCAPSNPTVYLKAGSVSSAVFPSLVKSQNKKARKVATAAGVRRSGGRKRRR